MTHLLNDSHFFPSPRPITSRLVSKFNFPFDLLSLDYIAFYGKKKKIVPEILCTYGFADMKQNYYSKLLDERTKEREAAKPTPKIDSIANTFQTNCRIQHIFNLN